jgi:hypothetical protein
MRHAAYLHDGVVDVTMKAEGEPALIVRQLHATDAAPAT